MIFLLRNQFFEKIITEGGLKLIVLNPFLDSLCNSAFKNIGLAPGIPKTCFQHPQDIVRPAIQLFRANIYDNFRWWLWRALAEADIGAGKLIK